MPIWASIGAYANMNHSALMRSTIVSAPRLRNAIGGRACAVVIDRPEPIARGPLRRVKGEWRSTFESLPCAFDPSLVRKPAELVAHVLALSDRQAEIKPTKPPLTTERD